MLFRSGGRRGTGILDCWLVSEGDGADIEGVAVRSVPLVMTDPKATAEMVSAGLDLAGVAPRAGDDAKRSDAAGAPPACGGERRP